MTKDEALKMALDWFESGTFVYPTTFIIAIKEALAQPEQEPVAYLCENAVGHKYFRWKKPSSTYKPIALYTTPPKREWVGLTEAEREEIENRPFSYNDWLWFYTHAVEAKIKEKNT